MTKRAFLFTALMLLTAALPAHAQDAGGGDSDSWKLMLQRNYEEIQYQIDYVDGVSQNLPGMVKQTRQDMASLRKKVDELMVLTRVSGSSPMELRSVLAGLQILDSQVDSVTQPLQKADQDLKNFQSRLDTLETEFSKQPVDTSQEGGKALSDLLVDLKKLKGKLGRVKTVLDQGLAPTRELESGIAQVSKAVTDRIPRAWKDYYLTQGRTLFSLGAWQEGAQRLADLPRYAVVFGSLLGGGQAKAMELLGRVLGLLAAMVLASALALRRAGTALPWLKSGRLLRALSWMSAGAAVVWAMSGTSFVLVNAETSAVAEILLARGVLVLAWYLRGLQTDGDAGTTGERKPAVRAWWMFAAATLLELPWLPEVARGGPWVLLLLLAGWLIRRSKVRAGKDLVSRLSSAGGWIYPLLCLPVLFGWVNLTLLAAKGWFLLLVFLQAGLSLHDLVGRLLTRPAKSLAAEVTVNLAGGIALPLTAILSAGGFLFWLSMSMGGQSVFLSIVSSNVEERGLSLDLVRLSGLYIGFYLARSATRVADRLVAELPSRRPDLERGVLNLLETLSTYAIWGVYALIAMNLAGASLTSLAVVAGGLSVGIGFGMQNIINNFISGLILLFGRSVQAGDILQIGDIWGTVTRVNIRNTVVQTFDNATLFVPNSDLIAQKIINWSHKDRRIRRSLEVGVAYGSDTGVVRELLIEAASQRPNVLAEPKPSAQLIQFGETSMRFKLLFWVDDLDNAQRVSSEVHMAVDRLFREKGIAMPHP